MIATVTGAVAVKKAEFEFALNYHEMSPKCHPGIWKKILNNFIYL